MLLDLAKEFSNRGYKISLCVLEFQGEYQAEIPSSIEVSVLTEGFFLRGLFGKLVGFIRFLKRKHPEVIFTTLPGGNLFCFVAWILTGCRSRLVLREASTPSIILKRYGVMKSLTVPILSCVAYRFASAIVAPSEGSASDISNFYGISRESISVIPNPIEPAELNLIDEHCHPYFKMSDPVIVGIGRLDKQKRFSDLIFALWLLHKQGTRARLLIFGEGPERQSLLQQVSSLGLTGFVDLPGYEINILGALKSCDVFALVSELEGLPNSLLQALACARPVVSTDCRSGPREILGGGRFGALVPVGDASAIARSINEALRLELEIDFGRALAPYSFARVIDLYEKVFQFRD